MNPDDPVMVPVAAIRELCDPFRLVCWMHDLDTPITRTEVGTAIVTGDLLAPDPDRHGPCTRAGHVARIAWFVVHGWVKPIHIDVGVPSLGHQVHWPVEDGNHRLAAAIYRVDRTIAAEISGSMGHAASLGLIL